MAVLKQSVLEGCTSIPLFIQTGSQMVFYQAAAPINWTKVTTNVNDAAMRVVNGTGGNVTNSSPFSSVFINRTVPLPYHSHSGTTGGESNGHWHTGSTGDISANHHHNADWFRAIGQGGATWAVANGGDRNTTSGVSNGHTHSFTTGGNAVGHYHSFSTSAEGTSGASMNFAVKYIDVLICKKD